MAVFVGIKWVLLNVIWEKIETSFIFFSHGVEILFSNFCLGHSGKFFPIFGQIILHLQVKTRALSLHSPPLLPPPLLLPPSLHHHHCPNFYDFFPGRRKPALLVLWSFSGWGLPLQFSHNHPELVMMADRRCARSLERQAEAKEVRCRSLPPTTKVANVKPHARRARSCPPPKKATLP